MDGLFNIYILGAHGRPLKSLGFSERLTVFRAISRSHVEAEKSRGKQIHRPMEYTVLEYFHFYLIKFIFWRQQFQGIFVTFDRLVDKT